MSSAEQVEAIIRKNVVCQWATSGYNNVTYTLTGIREAAEEIAALRSPPEGGDQGTWKPTGSSTSEVGGGAVTTEWFRSSDGLVRSFPHDFDPNIGGYAGMTFTNAHQPHIQSEGAGEP